MAMTMTPHYSSQLTSDHLSSDDFERERDEYLYGADMRPPVVDSRSKDQYEMTKYTRTVKVPGRLPITETRVARYAEGLREGITKTVKPNVGRLIVDPGHEVLTSLALLVANRVNKSRYTQSRRRIENLLIIVSIPSQAHIHHQHRVVGRRTCRALPQTSEGPRRLRLVEFQGHLQAYLASNLRREQEDVHLLPTSSNVPKLPTVSTSLLPALPSSTPYHP